MSHRRRFTLTVLAALCLTGADPVRAGALELESTRAAAGAPPVVPMIGDANRDCVVDIGDLTAVLGAWGTGDPNVDFDRDGHVGGIDRDIVLAVWGSTCAVRLVGDVNGDGSVNIGDLTRVLGRWLTANPQADVNQDGMVGEIDRDMVLANWGASLGRRLLGDHTGNDVVDIDDLLSVLGNWNPRTGQLELDLLLAHWGATSGRDVLGDVNGDRKVGPIDQELVLAAWGTPWSQADLDADGTVDIDDLNIVIARWNATAGSDLVGDVNGDWIVNRADQELVLATWGSRWTQADVNRDGAIGIDDLIAVNAGWGGTHGHRFTGDVTGDCVVDQTDQDILLAGWGQAFPPADVNADGSVNVNDLTLQLANWGNSCPR